MATDEDYPIDIPILVIEAQIFVAVKKFPFLPNKLIPNADTLAYFYKLSGSLQLVAHFYRKESSLILFSDHKPRRL